MKNAKIAKRLPVCKACGTILKSAIITTCPHCHIKLNFKPNLKQRKKRKKKRIVSPSLSSSPQQQRKIIIKKKVKKRYELAKCSYCNAIISADIEICPNCNTDFITSRSTQNWRYPEDFCRCQWCFAIVHKSVESCPNCGAKFESSLPLLSKQKKIGIIAQCTFCATKVEANTDFCPNCFHLLKFAPIAVTPEILRIHPELYGRRRVHTILRF